MLNTGFLDSIWLINHMYNSCSKHLIGPLPIFLQWLSVRIVSASIIAMRFILLFSYSMKVVATSKLIILVGFRNNTNPKISKASILHFSLANLESFFLRLNTSFIIFHFKPSILFFDILWRSRILINLTNSVSICRTFGGSRLCIYF